VNNKPFSWTGRLLAVLAMALPFGTLAQAPIPEHLSGIISDYTPLISTASPTGPWEMRGHWSLELKGRSGKADFSAYMSMGLSDYWVFTTNSDATDPTIRSAHTHHILMTGASVSTETKNCPANSPVNTARFVVSGPANFVTGNGDPALFEKKGPSMLQVCISGGTDVPLSNITLEFTGPATSHFGGQAIHGVVRFPHKDDSPEHEYEYEHEH